MLPVLPFTRVLHYVMLYPVTKRGRTRGRAQDQCSTSFFPWHVFLWGTRLQSETVCSWVIFYRLLTHLMHLVYQWRDRLSMATQPVIFHGEPFQKFAGQYVWQRVMAIIVPLLRPTQCSGVCESVKTSMYHSSMNIGAGWFLNKTQTWEGLFLTFTVMLKKVLTGVEWV